MKDNSSDPRPIGGSFRDPSGFVFSRDNIIFRQVNETYREHYELFNSSGLYAKLVDEHLLVSHQEVETQASANGYLVIAPQKIPFISYPYEWGFMQLKSAALLTLEIQKIALEHGMSLKDASAYNVQFIGVKPIFIDTLSFEKYEENKPWVGYRQFVEHFLSPLLLMAYLDVRMHKLSLNYLDGLPIDLVSKLLPLRSNFSFGIASHVHLHARFQKKYSDLLPDKKQKVLTKFSLLALIDNLRAIISSLVLPDADSHWQKYYSQTNYTEKASSAKENIVRSLISKISPKTVWDLGSNTGKYSLIAEQLGAYVVSSDSDFWSIETLTRNLQNNSSASILPLIIDLCAPSPSIGWRLDERQSFFQRGPADLVLALALVHHLAIGNNVPFEEITRCFASLSHKIIVEFVPKADSQVQRLLRGRVDIFPDYHEQHFIASMEKEFIVESRNEIPDSKRVLFLLVNKKYKSE